MKKTLVFAFAFCVPILLAGCGGHEQDDPQAAESGMPASMQKARATLTVSPDKVSSCQKGAHIDPIVVWQRIDTSIQNTKVTVSSPGSGEEKLFAVGGHEGSAKAGDWVVPGVTFRLYEANGGAALASYTVGTAPCVSKQ